MRNWWQSKWHLPRPEKACFCMPLRKGIIVLSYYNLVIVIAAILGFILEDHFKWSFRVGTTNAHETQLRMARLKMSPISYLIVYVGGILAEIAMVIVHLVGLHKKRLKLIRTYLFYATVYTTLVVTLRLTDFHTFMWKYEMTILPIFVGFRIYYIVLIRSQVKKMADRERNEDKQGEVELKTVEEETDYYWNATLSIEGENADEWKNPHSDNKEEITYLIEDDTLEVR